MTKLIWKIVEKGQQIKHNICLFILTSHTFQHFLFLNLSLCCSNWYQHCVIYMAVHYNLFRVKYKTICTISITIQHPYWFIFWSQMALIAIELTNVLMLWQRRLDKLTYQKSLKTQGSCVIIVQNADKLQGCNPALLQIKSQNYRTTITLHAILLSISSTLLVYVLRRWGSRWEKGIAQINFKCSCNIFEDNGSPSALLRKQWRIEYVTYCHHCLMRSSWEFHREGWCRLQFGSGGICHLFAPSHKWVGNIRSSSRRNTRRGGEAENLFVEGSFKREVGAPTIIGRAPPGDKSPAARISSASKSNDGKTCIKFEEADLRAEITLQWSKSDLHLLHDFLECRVRRMTRG